MNKYTKFALAIAAAFAVVGCGGGSSTSNKSAKGLSGVYEDAPIDGVEYSCGSKAGITKDGGKFEYEVGKSCKFKIGDLVLREVDATIINSANLHIKEFNLDVVNFLSLLDKDANLDNGIQIDTNKAKKAIEEAGGKESNYEDVVRLYIDSFDKTTQDILNNMHSNIDEIVSSHIKKQTENLLEDKRFYVVLDNKVEEFEIGNIDDVDSRVFFAPLHFQSNIKVGDRDLTLEILFYKKKDPYIIIFGENREDAQIAGTIVAQDSKGILIKDTYGIIDTLYSSKTDAQKAVIDEAKLSSAFKGQTLYSAKVCNNRLKELDKIVTTATTLSYYEYDARGRLTDSDKDLPYTIKNDNEIVIDGLENQFFAVKINDHLIKLKEIEENLSAEYNVWYYSQKEAKINAIEVCRAQ
jgi:hypothetical protein